MRFVLALVGLAVATMSLGCGGVEIAESADAGLDATPDGPRVYCSSRCGMVDPADLPDGAGQIQECPPGDICGQFSTLGGLECCDPSDHLCAVGSPEPIGGCH